STCSRRQGGRLPPARPIGARSLVRGGGSCSRGQPEPVPRDPPAHVGSRTEGSSRGRLPPAHSVSSTNATTRATTAEAPPLGGDGPPSRHTMRDDSSRCPTRKTTRAPVRKAR